MAVLQIVFLLFAVFNLALVEGGKMTDPFIVGGERAEIADHPHSLAMLDMSRGGYICGASIIGSLWALSAAHCLHAANVQVSQINLYGGSSSRVSGGHLFFAQAITLHPNYNRVTLDFDIVLIEVVPTHPMEGFPNVSPIPLPPACDSACCGICPDGNNVVVAGWGRVDDGSLPIYLMQVDKAVMSNAQCAPFWPPAGRITSRMFCTIIENGRDSCNGDSGTAVVRDGVQHGVVNFGSSVCGDGSRPAVYARVEEPQIRNWITHVSGI